MFLEYQKWLHFFFQNPKIDIWRHAKAQLPWHFSSDADEARVEQENLVWEMYGDTGSIKSGDEIMSDGEIE